jgi:beta-xylosidase
MKTSQIQMRDPFVLPIPEESRYVLFGTTDTDCWKGAGAGFDCYKSTDLENWEGPFPAFRPDENFWATENFWAPEVHRYRGAYYMFATFFTPGRYRGTQILRAEKPEGPYKPLTDGPVTPDNWQCLDGTLYVDEQNHPWIVFCHEWTQIHNGAICAMRLTDDLTAAAAKPVFLFNASEAPWASSNWPGQSIVPGEFRFPTFVTDGPFLYKHSGGSLLMLWSSWDEKGYVQGIARSENGLISGPWTQEPAALMKSDSGHGMLFQTLENELRLALHGPNDTPNERPHFFPVEETEDSIRITTGQPRCSG